MMYEAITNWSSYIYKIAFKYSYTDIRQINNLQVNANWILLQIINTHVILPWTHSNATDLGR